MYVIDKKTINTEKKLQKNHQNKLMSIRLFIRDFVRRAETAYVNKLVDKTITSKNKET